MENFQYLCGCTYIYEPSKWEKGANVYDPWKFCIYKRVSHRKVHTSKKKSKRPKVSISTFIWIGNCDKKIWIGIILNTGGVIAM